MRTLMLLIVALCAYRFVEDLPEILYVWFLFGFATLLAVLNDLVSLANRLVKHKVKQASEVSRVLSLVKETFDPEEKGSNENGKKGGKE